MDYSKASNQSTNNIILIRPRFLPSNQAIQSQVVSQNVSSSSSITRPKMPAILKDILKEPNTPKASSQHQNKSILKNSKVGRLVNSKIHNIRSIMNCEICETPFKKSDKQPYMCDCEHKFNFCESCLHHYVIYKVKTFEEVYCPRQQCNILLDINGQFFKQLPFDIQKDYNKLHRFYINANDPTIKLCPRQNCEGFIKNNMENSMICNVCNNQFCQKCLLLKHEGDCDTHQLQFFESNLHYRQCKKCKFVIQKNQGCNHLKCRCGFQFCYVCGADWLPTHYGNHDQNGQLVVVSFRSQEQCLCCEQNCGHTLACIFKAPLKVLLTLLLLSFLSFMFLIRYMFIMITLLCVCIVLGLFGFSFELLSKLNGAYFLLGVLFFPFLMIAGIGLALRDIYCTTISELMTEFGNMCCFQSIWSI